jgi:hypothetical protein
MAIVMGVLPQFFLKPMESPVEGIIKQVHRQPGFARQAAPPPAVPPLPAKTERAAVPGASN